MARQPDDTLQPRVKQYLDSVVADSTLPISVRAVADAVGCSPQTLYNHDSRAKEEGQQPSVLDLIRSARERQERIANRVKRRRGAKEDAETIERLKSELEMVTHAYEKLLEQWVLVEVNALSAGIDIADLLAPPTGKPDRSVPASRKNTTRFRI